MSKKIEKSDCSWGRVRFFFVFFVVEDYFLWVKMIYVWEVMNDL